MLSRHRQLLVVAIALVSWVAPATPEVLEKKKKKHHHHHRHGKHHLAEGVNNTGNRTLDEAHAHAHRKASHGLANASVQPAAAEAAPAAARPSAAVAKPPVVKAKSVVAAAAAATTAAHGVPSTARPQVALAGQHDRRAAAKAEHSSVVHPAAPPAVAPAARARLRQAHPAAHSPKAPRIQRGQISVGGPLPPDFEERFVQGVVQATGVSAKLVSVLGVRRVDEADGNIDELSFAAPTKVVEAVEDQAADPESKLARGILRIFLIDRSSAEADQESPPQDDERVQQDAEPVNFVASRHYAEVGGASEQEQESEPEAPATPPKDDGIDIDSEMPYGDLEPFGREDTAQELTDNSIRESDEMVDQLERAEVAEEKRAVFRALTRLRGAAITSFDGIAHSQTGNIDEYNKKYQWRGDHPLHHLADEESDVNKWAFPNGEDC